MSSETIYLVQGDTKPEIIVSLTDNDGVPLDVTGATVRMKFKQADALVLTDTLIATPINAATGQIQFPWKPTTLQTAPGTYLGEVEITYADGSIHTVYDVQRFVVRKEF